MNFEKLDEAVLGPSASAFSPAGGRHFVQIYDDESALGDAVATFLALGIKAGDAAIAIARPDHIEVFEKELRVAGIDVEEALRSGLYRSFPSEDLLASFMVDGMPERRLFMDSVGGLIRFVGKGRNVRAFGEMVADLWADGRVPAAMRLEELWNDLASSLKFDLFCAYPADGFREDELASLAHVCRQHSQVIPPVQERA